MAQHTTLIRLVLISTAFVALGLIGGSTNAQTVPPGKLPSITNTQTPSVPTVAVACPAPMVRIGTTCQCPEGTVKTSPTTCALRAYIPLQKSNDD